MPVTLKEGVTLFIPIPERSLRCAGQIWELAFRHVSGLLTFTVADDTFTECSGTLIGAGGVEAEVIYRPELSQAPRLEGIGPSDWIELLQKIYDSPAWIRAPTQDNEPILIEFKLAGGQEPSMTLRFELTFEDYKRLNAKL